MISKLYDELYPRLNHLLRINSNFDDFYNPWWNEKCSDYKGDKLSDYYNIFFSRFVTFNALYNTIIYTKESIGLLERKKNKHNKVIERGDKEKATTLMVKELSDSTLATLFEMSEIAESVNKLTEIIESKIFVISHKAGQPVPEEDFLILKKIKSPNMRERYTGVLELLYNLRCNLFHGDKSYQNDQLILLKPINEIIFHVVTFLYNAFKGMTYSLINTIEKEIKLLETTEVQPLDNDLD